MRYRLRTLLIAATVGPPVLATIWWLLPEVILALLWVGGVGVLACLLAISLITIANIADASREPPGKT